MASGVFTLKQQTVALGQGAWTNQPPISVNYLVVAGGGGGNDGNGGGGGGGGLLQGSIPITPGTSYTVTVGSGGAANAGAGTGTVGSNSVFGSITSTGGGGGAYYSTGTGGSGGSGGGGGSTSNSAGGQGVAGQGNKGGKGAPGSAYQGGGGGGAGVTPADAQNSAGGNGGAGIASDISGIRTVYAGGGGGGGYNTPTQPIGGAGGGGNGSNDGASSTTAYSSSSGGGNTGGGGGGGGGGGKPASAGGSGIVIISYPGTTQWFTGGTLSYANGNVIHTFYSSGTLAPTAASNYINTDYQIERSLRFNSADSAYLNRTPSSAGNRKTWTWSGWLKRSALSTGYILDAGTGPNTGLFIGGASDLLGFFDYTSPSYNLEFITTQSFRDVSAWYHIVVAVDTTQATSTNRVKIYLNGSQITAFGTATYPSQNFDTGWNNATAHRIGGLVSGGSYLNGYMTEVNFIDGQALTPYSFGYYNPNTGIWSPLKFVGTYGTNGFYLNFSDNSNTTSTTLGKDYSGNGNNWTPNNFSVTAGAGNDSLVDSPTAYGTDTGAGGEVRGNYCTLNPLTKGAYLTLSNGNLQTAGNSATDSTDARSTFAFSTGKWYWEFTPTTINSIYPFNGIILSKDATSPNTGTTNQVGVATDSCAYLASGSKRVSNSTTSYGNSYTANDVIGVAVDADNGAIYFSKNGTWQNSGSPTSGSSKTGAAFTWTGGSSEYVAAVSEYNTSASNINFGQRPFAYTAPSGFKALCTQNLPTPTIGATSATQAGDYFNTVLYTGNGSTQTISGVGFQPDLVWAKDRVQAANHRLFDAVRGPSKILYSSLTIAETTDANGLTSFDSNGFSIGSSQINDSNFNYVAWNWKANGAGSSNTAGTISSTVSANTTAGFSIVTYTGNGTSGATVGHGCLVNGAATTPEMLIFKNRDATDGWIVFQKYVGGTDDWWDTRLLLASTAARADNAGYLTAAPTSTLLTLSNTSPVNTSSQKYLVYCFAPVAGYSAFGSYTGNGVSNGPFIYTGFRPRYVMIKNSSNGSAPWYVLDTARSPYNEAVLSLNPNSSAAEITDINFLDINSNGFKVRTDGSYVNGNTNTIIYAAFAESPFKYALAR